MTIKGRPLRAGLIGFSSSSAATWARSAHLPNFLTKTGQSNFTITALLNSSTAAAQTAIKNFNLPSTTKAYGDPEDLAKDQDIDIVICNTRVDKHYETILPSIRAGQDVFVEWPIAANLKQISTIVSAANKSGARVAVGLQRRWAPPVIKLREIVQSGKLGKVLSVDVRSFGGTGDRADFIKKGSYFADRAVGGNFITIAFGHLFDYVLSVTGELDPKTVQARVQLQRPDSQVKDSATQEIIETLRSDVPDLVSLNGAIAESPYTDPSATLSLLFRRGQPFPGTPITAWTINFEHGEVQLLSPSDFALEPGPNDEPLTIKIHHFASNEVENIEWDYTDLQKEVPLKARNVQSSLYAFANGDEGWVSLADAAKRAEQIEGFLQDWDNSRK